MFLASLFFIAYGLLLTTMLATQVVTFLRLRRYSKRMTALIATPIDLARGKGKSIAYSAIFVAVYWSAFIALLRS